MICNEGYTIERFIHGMEAVRQSNHPSLPSPPPILSSLPSSFPSPSSSLHTQLTNPPPSQFQTYNDVPTWRYKDLVPTLGATDPSTYTLRQIRTKSDVEALLQDEDFATARKLRFVELYMPKEDAPLPLKLTAEASAKNNAKQ